MTQLRGITIKGREKVDVQQNIVFVWDDDRNI